MQISLFQDQFFLIVVEHKLILLGMVNLLILLGQILMLVGKNTKSFGPRVNPIQPMGNSGYHKTWRPKQTIVNKQEVNQANNRNHFAKSLSPVRRPIPQVSKFNQRNFSKSKSPIRRPNANNAAKVFNFYAVKGKGGSPTRDLYC